MERRTALALTVSSVVTLAVGAMAFASLGGADVLGFGSTDRGATPTIVTETQKLAGDLDTTAATTSTTLVVADPTPSTLEVVTLPSVPGATAPAGQAPRATVPAPGPIPAATPSPPAAGTAPPASPPATPAATTPATTPVTTPVTTPAATTAPAPATTAPRATVAPTTTATPTNTAPPGARIPSDWPPGVPIPPIPPGCVDPQLEDNGVWNCQH